MSRQVALLLTFEESEIDVLEKLSKKDLQEVQKQAAHSVRKELFKRGLIEESKTFIKIEESEKDEDEEELESFILVPGLGPA